MEESTSTALAAGQFKVGPLFVNLRVLLEPLGFLRIVMVVLAILTFSLTAGYNPSPSRNSIQCNSLTLSIGASYPYSGSSFTFSFNSTNPNLTCPFSDNAFSGSAQYFVGMGVLTFLYLLLILTTYVLLVNPTFPYAKYILIGDLFVSFAFGFFYLLADIAWSVGTSQLGNYISSQLTSCINCSSAAPKLQVPLAAIASVIFGWLMAFLWFASIWFIYRDGPFYGKIGLDTLKAKLQRGGTSASAPEPQPQQPQEP